MGKTAEEILHLCNNLCDVAEDMNLKASNPSSKKKNEAKTAGYDLSIIIPKYVGVSGIVRDRRFIDISNILKDTEIYNHVQITDDVIYKGIYKHASQVQRRNVRDNLRKATFSLRVRARGATYFPGGHYSKLYFFGGFQ